MPFARGGRTPGGAFVRMTCETRERPPARRVVFLAVRVASLWAAFAFAPVAFPALALFFLLFRRMPYDFI